MTNRNINTNNFHTNPIACTREERLYINYDYKTKH